MRFAVTEKTLFPRKLATFIVGHAPRELSRHISYTFQYGTIITAEVKDEWPKRSPLVHGGLETLIEMSIVWDDAVKINKNKKNKLETAQTGNHTNQSNKILKKMRLDVDEEDEES